MRQLLLATNNAGKVAEFRTLLAGCGWQILAPSEIGLVLDVEETGATYATNAGLKARAFADASNLWALADDSGLEVDLLGGGPGVYSARFGGAGLTDADRVTLLLGKISSVPMEKRTARFRCVLALVTPEGRLWQTEGVCEGLIAAAPRGDNGFGYDPIFSLLRFGRTMAELESSQKNRISHRALAAAAMRPILEMLSQAEQTGGAG